MSDFHIILLGITCFASGATVALAWSLRVVRGWQNLATEWKQAAKLWKAVADLRGDDELARKRAMREGA